VNNRYKVDLVAGLVTRALTLLALRE